MKNLGFEVMHMKITRFSFRIRPKCYDNTIRTIHSEGLGHTDVCRGHQVYVHGGDSGTETKTQLQEHLPPEAKVHESSAVCD